MRSGKAPDISSWTDSNINAVAKKSEQKVGLDPTEKLVRVERNKAKPNANQETKWEEGAQGPCPHPAPQPIAA